MMKESSSSSLDFLPFTFNWFETFSTSEYALQDSCMSTRSSPLTLDRCSQFSLASCDRKSSREDYSARALSTGLPRQLVSPNVAQASSQRESQLLSRNFAAFSTYLENEGSALLFSLPGDVGQHDTGLVARSDEGSGIVASAQI